MDRSTHPHADQRENPRPEEQGGLLNNQGVPFNPFRKIAQTNMQLDLDPHQSSVIHAGIPIAFSSSLDRGGHIVPVDRSKLVGAEIPRAAALTHDNLHQLHTLLANPTPMARWESESPKTGVWNKLGKVAMQQHGEDLSKGKRAVNGGRAAPEQGQKDMF